ncbi:MAG: leucine-rich repeat domain-containing protein [Lachnospiraceae bacterium]|nr:leucine-rich repeat domain-containing protein [Lachnospiraceae bacterium]
MRQLKKRLVCAVLTLSMVMAAGHVPNFVAKEETVEAAVTTSGWCGSNVKWSFNYHSCTLTLTGTGTTYDYTGYQNNARLEPWYSLNKNIKNIVIDERITHLGTNLFLGLTTVESIKVSCAVDYESSTFSSLNSVDKVVLTAGDIKMKDYSSVREYTPWMRGAAKTIYVDEGIKELPSSAFYDCSSVKRIVIADSVEKIGHTAFMNCSSLTEMSIPCSVVFEPGILLFQNAAKLEKLVVTKGNGIMPDYCTNMTSGPTLFAGVSPFGRAKNIYIKSGVKKIGAYAFYYANAENIILPETVEEIGENAFYSSNIKKLIIMNKNCIIPDSEKTINPNIQLLYSSTADTSYKYALKYGNPTDGFNNVKENSSKLSYIGKTQYFCFTVPERSYYKVSVKRSSGTNSVKLKGMFCDAAFKASMTYGGTTGDMGYSSIFEEGFTYVCVVEPLNYEEVQNEVSYPFFEYKVEETAGNVYQTGSITAENELTDHQIVKMQLIDTDGVEGYYWGTNSDYTKNAYYTAYKFEKTNGLYVYDVATTSGTYYLAIKDEKGNVTNVGSKTFCKTTLELNKGSYNNTSPIDCNYIITEKGKDITLPSMYCTYSESINGYSEYIYKPFNGWTKRDTYNWKSTTDLPDTVTFKVNEDSKYYAVWKLGVDDIRYSFINSSYSLGYPSNYEIPASSYGLVYGYSSVYNLLTKVSSWGGSCYGFSSTAGMFLSKNYNLDVTDFNSNAKNAMGLTPTSKGGKYPFDVRTLIEANQVGYSLNNHNYVSTSQSRFGNKDLTPLLNAIDSAKTTGNAVVISIWGDTSGHSVLAYDYKVASPVRTVLYVYDPNFTHPRYITVRTSGTKMTGWEYYMNNSQWWGTDYNKTDTKDYFRYDTIDDYSNAWTNRDKDDDKYYSMLLINSQYVTITDANGNVVYQINGHTIKSNESVTDLEPYINENNMSVLRVPVGQYTITNLDSSVANLQVNAANSENGVNVSTTADTVTIDVSAEDGVNSASVDTEKGDTYDIEMTYITDYLDNRISIQGTATSDEDVAVDYEDHKMSIDGTDKFNMKVNGKKYKKIRRNNVKDSFRMTRDLNGQDIVIK